MSNVRYIYFRNGEHFGPAISFGYFINQDNDIVVSVAFCSEEDRFNKKIARKILNGRLEKGRCVVIPTNFTKEPKYEVVVDLIKHSFRSKDYRHQWKQIIPIFPKWVDMTVFSFTLMQTNCITNKEKNDDIS